MKKEGLRKWLKVRYCFMAGGQTRQFTMPEMFEVACCEIPDSVVNFRRTTFWRAYCHVFIAICLFSRTQFFSEML